MELHVVIEGRKGLTKQLYQQLRGAIETGRLAAQTQLPSSRVLAEQLGISRKTVSDTYARLTYENLLSGAVGKGTYVNNCVVKTSRKRSHLDLASVELIQRWQAMPRFSHHPVSGDTLRYDFIGGVISRSQFPHDEWRRCTSYALREIAKTSGYYSQPEGLPLLRNAIARHVSFSRGIHCADNDVVVCNGAQQALDLISRVLIQPGCTVAMEDPGYPLARFLFKSSGAKVASIPVDDEGMRVELIPEGTRLIYVTPSHQFPLGMPMSQARRQALLQRAHELGAIIIEDDYDSEFRYEGQPIDSLQSMDQWGLVAYVGTFSKTLLPELRVGYMVLPPAILDAVIRAKQLTDLHTSTLPQWALAKFIGDGCLLKHIRRSHMIYSGRRERILTRIGSDLSPWFEAVPSIAGFHMALLCKVPVDIPWLIEEARKVDVGLYSLADFFDEQAPKAGLFMGFGAIETLDIDIALDRLVGILKKMG